MRFEDFACKLIARGVKSLSQRLVLYIFRNLLALDRAKTISECGYIGISSGGDVIELRLPTLYWTFRILLKPDIMVGQCYMEGHWSVQPESLFEFLYLIRSQNTSKLQNWFLLSNGIHLFRDALKQRLFPIRSTRAVVEHYNTDSSFMSFILGRSYSYTCAFFQNPTASLDEAQASKLELIAQRISLNERHAVLDLGTGWGYAPFPLAEDYGCNVTGITLSEAQVEFCNTRRQSSPAAERLKFVCADYASYEPPSKFDRVISIGMLEHVGKFQYTHFFDKVAAFLREDGIALIHSMIDERETSTDAWIDKYIFPGGYIPTASEVIGGIERSQCELIGVFTQDKMHYFRTLELWKQNLFNNRSRCELRLRQIGLTQTNITKIIRIWEYFLSASQIAFSNYGHCRTAHFIVRQKAQ
jgi:cyclopropane-fatty-acyl-phospholipid synthase